MFVGILGCTYALYFPKNSYLKGIIELILQITLIINGLFLSRVGVVYIYSPLMVRPTETKGQEGQILTLREANPGPQSGLRLMLAPKLGVDFIALAVTKYVLQHGLWTPGEEIPFTARQKIKSQSQIFTYGRSIFCLSNRPKIFRFL